MAGIEEAKQDARRIIDSGQIDDPKRFKRLLAFLKFHSRHDSEAAELYDKLNKYFPRNRVLGEELFLRAVDTGFSRLGSGVGVLENLYRASLVGASYAAVSHLAVFPQLNLLWGRGDVTRAARLLEVWGSTIAISLLDREPDQDAVCRDVAREFATVVFDWSSDDPLLELQAFRMQLEADHKDVMPGGTYFPGKGMELLHLRCVRALGIPVDFRHIPTPIPVGTLIGDLNIVESQYLTSSLEAMISLHILYVGNIVTSGKVWCSGDGLQSNERAQILYALSRPE